MTDEERNELVIKVADFIIDTRSSTRVAAKQFKISNYTVSTYMNERLLRLNLEKYNKVKEIIKFNKPLTVEDNAVKERIFKEIKMLKEGQTTEQIINSLNITINTFYRDLSNRLPKLSKIEYEKIKQVLLINKLSNLNIGNSEYTTTQKRDSSGKFV